MKFCLELGTALGCPETNHFAASPGWRPSGKRGTPVEVKNTRRWELRTQHPGPYRVFFDLFVLKHGPLSDYHSYQRWLWPPLRFWSRRDALQSR